MERTALPAIGLSTTDEARIQRLPPYLNVFALGEQVLHLKRTATRAVISRPDFPVPIELGGRHRLRVTVRVWHGSSGSHGCKRTRCRRA
ncbi:MAG: hypothetical protein ABWY12_07125 [Burkholderiales bacterium]